MKISGFTYVRNGFQYGYPFLQSIQSLLPIVDEMVVVVGDSTDNTRESIVNLADKKIRIIDSVWDERLRNGGEIFAIQANLGLENISGDWAFHLQVDEVLHEKDYGLIADSIIKAGSQDSIEGIIFPFYHFWGDYNHIRITRQAHRHEIRLFKRNKLIRSYRDSQGFRKYSSMEAYSNGEEGEKLRVIKTAADIYHYSYTRNPELMKKKTNFFHKFWHSNAWLKEHTDEAEFDYNEVDMLGLFTGSHPLSMSDIIEKKDWNFEYDPAKSTMSPRERILFFIEKKTGRRLFEYKNYKLLDLKAEESNRE